MKSEEHLEFINRQLKDFYMYSISMETNFEHREKVLLEEFETERSEIEKDNSHIWHQKYYYHTVIFLNIHRTSLFTNVFGMVEYELRKACNFHYRNNKTNISMNDFKGNSDFEKAKSYLTKICEIDFSSLNPEWNYLQNAKDLRNVLTHNQGEFLQTNEKKSKRLMELIRQKDYLEFEPNETYENNEEEYYSKDGKIIIKSKEFNEELIDNASQFFNKLLEGKLKYCSQQHI
jgi:hypothetical protein